MEYKKVKCMECGRELFKITNTHLWVEHRMSVSNYREKYPTAEIEDKQLAMNREAHKRGKHYEAIYGEKKGKDKRVQQINNAIIQFTDQQQRDRRSILNKGKILTEETKEKLRKKNIITGNYVYRKKALSTYKEECAACGKNDNIVIHHKDGNHYNHDIDNLVPLCRSCHAKITKDFKTIEKRTGIPLVEKGMVYILKGLEKQFGLDINNENFRMTPKRVARAYYEIFEGINCESEIKNIAETSFPSEYGGMIMERDIRVFSMCPHHFLPVEYIVNVAYIPDKKTVGISKLARITEILAKQPELQEMFTEKLSNLLYNELQAKGVMVQVRGRHMCMVMRGIKKDSWTITASIKGAFEKDPAARAEFLAYARAD